MATEMFLLGSNAERADELVRCVGGAAKDPEVLSALANACVASDYSMLLSVALKNHSAIFKLGQDEIEGVFVLMLSMFSAIPEEALESVVKQISDAATSSTDAKTNTLRLRILVNLYNSVTVKAHKLAVFSTLIQYAADSKHMDALAPYLATSQSWKVKWGLSTEEAGDLFLTVSNCLEKAGNFDEAQIFLIRYLATFDSEPEERRKIALVAAKKAALNFIKAPAVSQRSNLAALAVVRDMAGIPELSRLHQVVDIFSHKTLDAFAAFHASNATYLTELGVDAASSTETMRLLTLCTLAAGADSLSYDAVATSLKIRAEEVEAWIVRAISLGLIDARMDQQARALTVLRSVQREFSASQWKDLQKKLHLWRDSVAGMSATLERNPVERR